MIHIKDDENGKKFFFLEFKWNNYGSQEILCGYWDKPDFVKHNHYVPWFRNNHLTNYKFEILFLL